MKKIRIGKRVISANMPSYIIAEAGVNHNGDVNIALDLVKKAKQSGADCVKFQTFKAERVVTAAAPKAKYQLEVTDKEESQLDMLKKLELDYSHYQNIIAYCEEIGIDFLSTPYSMEDALFLDKLGVKAFKIASGQLIEHLFLEQIAALGKPLILSTGMATFSEAFDAIEHIRKINPDLEIAVLQCTTNYPSKIEEANINSMVTIRDSLNVVGGYSDHVPNNYACYAAVSLGASIIEKHFTLDNSMEGPDHLCSLEPDGFKELVNGIRSIEVSLGSKVKKPSAIELDNSIGMRRSIVLNRDYKKGEVVKEEDVAFKRPYTGLKPNDAFAIIGKKVNKDVSMDTFIGNKDIEW